MKNCIFEAFKKIFHKKGKKERGLAIENRIFVKFGFKKLLAEKEFNYVNSKKKYSQN